MSAECFIDTNLFIYQLEALDARKTATADHIIRRGIETGNACISFHVVQECLNTVLRKAEIPLDTDQTRAYLEAVLAPLFQVSASIPLYQRTLDIQARYHYGFYDALIIAAALDVGCTRLYSEDLQHGQRIERLTIENPFLEGRPHTMARRPQNPRTVETLTHEQARRKNIPTAEYQSVMQKEAQSPVRVAYERRNRDLDPQLVWRGKDEQDWSDLVVHAPPLYIQEKVHPKVLIDDLLKQTRERREYEVGAQPDLFADFNGIPQGVDKTEFYQHEQNWSNRMILGDSLQVMASLAEREGLRGKVQCIYLDPPYGIKFNSNFQWSTTSRDVKDGNADHITREPEQVMAFRDTWRDGIHSYLTYLRDRLTVARDLLADSGSIFVQIGDENVHRVRALMDEIFGQDNFVSQVTVEKTAGSTKVYLSNVADTLLWYCRHHEVLKYRQFMLHKVAGGVGGEAYTFVETEVGE